MQGHCCTGRETHCPANVRQAWLVTIHQMGRYRLLRQRFQLLKVVGALVFVHRAYKLTLIR